MTARDQLRAAAALLAPAGAWCQRDYARNAHGTAVFSRDPEAVCWCLEGALSRVQADAVARRAVRRVIGGRYLTVEEWNDRRGRTQAQVLAALGRAAARVDAP